MAETNKKRRSAPRPLPCWGQLLTFSTFVVVRYLELTAEKDQTKPRRSLIRSGGSYVKLRLTFKRRGDLIAKHKLLLRKPLPGTILVSRLKVKVKTMKTMNDDKDQGNDF